MSGPTGAPAVTLDPVTESGRTLLWRMMQLYLHDLSEFDGRGPEADGEFQYSYYEAYFGGPAGRQAFLLYSGGALAGFAMLRPLDNGRMQMAEFFVLRSTRRIVNATSASRQAM